jgi:hypothetical protein
MTNSIPRIALTALISLALSGCLEKSDEYDTIEEARKNHLFEKGWLPDLLPASTYDLKVVTAVEIPAGHGKFRFDPKEYHDFAAKLEPHEGVMSKVESDNESIRELLDRGYEAHAYSSGTINWIFLCEQRKAVCEFFVWG